MSIKLQTFHGSDSSWTQIGTDVEYGTSNKITLPTTNKYVSDKLKISLSGIEYWDGSIYIPPLPVGGRIFYDAGSNGATYTFYDSSMNVLPTQTVAGLANAVYYSVTGTPTKDRWYVYDNTTGLVSSKTWGKYGTSCGMTSNTIGSGKTNTATMMTLSPDGTLWTWLRDTINANSVGGCSDWFIASEAEQDQLRASGLVNWYSSYYIWSSVEFSANYAYTWRHINSSWGINDKSNSRCGFAARAF